MTRIFLFLLISLMVSFAQNSWQSNSVYENNIETDGNFNDASQYSSLISSAIKASTNEIRCTTAEEIQNAMKNAQPGDSIVIEPGTYIGSIWNSGNSRAHFYGANNGTAENPIYLTGANLNVKPVLKGESISDSYLLHITGDHWFVKGLVLRKAKKGIMLDNSNFTQIFNTEIDTIGEEAIHIRDGSSYNLISNCTITETGLYTADFGEGVYFGSDVGKWGDFTKECDYNVVDSCTIGPNVRAESVDIKEGSTGNVVKNSIFHGAGISGANYSDSFIDAKGNYSIIRDNIAYRNNNPIITDAFQVHQRSPGWGIGNAFFGNQLHLDDANAYVVDVSNGSAFVGDNIRNPEGNMYKGNYSEPDHIPPIVEITGPLSGSYESGQTIELTANALDLDGEIIKVEFYANDDKLGESVSQPYKYVWNSVSAGEYNFYAKAFDNELITTVSDSILVKVDTLEENISKFELNFLMVRASSYIGNYWDANTVDGDLNTRWEADGDGEWIHYILDQESRISFLKIAFYSGTSRQYTFDIDISNDGIEWQTVLENVVSSGTISGYERFDLDDVVAKYIRYTGHMNNVNSLNSLLEFEIWGSDDLTSIKNNIIAPEIFKLNQNYPNPFNPRTHISFSVPRKENINISIYNAAGQLVETLVDGEFAKGNHIIIFNAEKYTSGVYFYRLQGKSFIDTKKMILIK